MVLKHAVLTGPPGVGKTTLVQKICKALESKGVPVTGFVTQEIREGAQRTGFRIITTENQVGTLSSTKSKSPHKVGQYGVEVAEFESIVLPLFQKEKQPGTVLIIDEIGKMEMFSTKFQDAVRQAFASEAIRIVATIPIPKGRPIPLVEEVRSHPDARLFQIDKTNRNTILQEILSIIAPDR